jgi:hypothetical protein
MSDYALYWWQANGIHGFIRVNRGGLGSWSMDYEGLTRCLSGQWRGGHADLPQGSIYFSGDTQYFGLNQFIPFEHNSYAVGTEGTGYFITRPNLVSLTRFNWRITMKDY